MAIKDEEHAVDVNAHIQAIMGYFEFTQLHPGDALDALIWCTALAITFAEDGGGDANKLTRVVTSNIHRAVRHMTTRCAISDGDDMSVVIPDQTKKIILPH